tara:strand:- start:951 stop:1181 length:231 start_codon:yes stop_codon:yes gene_type:complete
MKYTNVTKGKMTQKEKIKNLIRENYLQKERIKLLENVINDFHKKMNAMLTFCKIQDRQTDYEILQSKFNKTYQDNE